MSDLNSLLIFAQIIESKGFAAAARRLKMPTSTVSRRVAELEHQLGVRLIERSTRGLRLTDIGAEVLEYARQTVTISEAVNGVASQRQKGVSGLLRLAAPPSISDSLIAPLASAFQARYPEVRVQVFITERIVDQIAEGLDLSFRVGRQEDTSLVRQRLLTYRHQLVASAEYAAGMEAPGDPDDLLRHRLLAFSFWRPRSTWNFVDVETGAAKALAFEPYLSINEYSGLVTALLAGTGIGELPPIVQPELLRSGRMVRVMPGWQFRKFHLSAVHLGIRYVPRHVQLFKEFAAQFALSLFPEYPPDPA